MSAPEYKNGDLVEIEADSIRALARVRDSYLNPHDVGLRRIHLALELGEYLPWIDAAVVLRHGNDACAAQILHAGATTALLQVIETVEEVAPPAAKLEPSVRSIDDDW